MRLPLGGIILFLGLGCWPFGPAAKANSPAPAHALLRGIVRDTAGKPVAQAMVALVLNDAVRDAVPNVVRSAADGSFTFARPATGHYALTASAPNKTGVFRPNVDKAADTNIDLILGDDQGVTLVGVVVDLAGKPVTTALATLSRSSDEEGDMWYAPVDREGRFRVRLPKARYAVLASAPGYRADAQFSTEKEGEAPSITVEMQPEDPAGAPVLAELRAASVPLQSCDPATPTLADMLPLTGFVGNAHLVALGEGSHGGHEIFQLKHRLFEFLVQKMGFTVLAIEASWADTLAVEDYLMTGNGDPELLAPSMGFWIWNTGEMTDLLRWMRAYNADAQPLHKLHFVGFDMQHSPTSVAALLGYVGKHDKAYSVRLTRSLAGLGNELDASRFGGWEANRRATATADVAALESYLDAHRKQLVARSDETQWVRARHHAQILAQFIQLNSDSASYSTKRDRFMMQNVDWIVAHQPAGTKMALWAANGHVQKHPLVGTAPSMGQLLAEHHGDDYRVFLTLFDSGAFRAWGAGTPPRGLMEHTMAPAPIGSVEGTLTRLGFDVVATNLHALRLGSTAERWSHYRLRIRTLGSSYRKGQSMVVNRPAEVADALFLIRHLTASRYLGPVWKPQLSLASPRNGGFEEQPASAPPAGWDLSRSSLQSGYRSAVEQSGCQKGQHCAIVRRSGPRLVPGWGALEQSIDATAYRGQRVRLRAAVRVETSDPQGDARLLLETENAELDEIDVSNMPGEAIRLPEWTEYELEIDVAPRAAVLCFGLAVTGDTSAWLDSVEVTSLGPTPSPAH